MSFCRPFTWLAGYTRDLWGRIPLAWNLILISLTDINLPLTRKRVSTELCKFLLIWIFEGIDEKVAKSGLDFVWISIKWIPFDSPWWALLFVFWVHFDWTKRLVANWRKPTAGVVTPFTRTLHTGALRTNVPSDRNGHKRLLIEELTSYRLVCRLMKFD